MVYESDLSTRKVKDSNFNIFLHVMGLKNKRGINKNGKIEKKRRGYLTVTVIETGISTKKRLLLLLLCCLMMMLLFGVEPSFKRQREGKE